MDFQIQTDKMVVANHPDIVVVNKWDKKAVVVDVAIPSDSNIRKEEHKNIKKYQWLKKGARLNMGSKGISDTSGDRSTWGCNPQDGKVAPTNSRSNT